VTGRPEWRSWENAQRLWRYDVDGKPFAYVVYVTLGERHMPTGRDVALASATYYEYRDDDGDGRFEARKGGMGKTPDLPVWATSGRP
jgi:hypothetical protein